MPTIKDEKQQIEGAVIDGCFGEPVYGPRDRLFKGINTRTNIDASTFDLTDFDQLEKDILNGIDQGLNPVGIFNKTDMQSHGYWFPASGRKSRHEHPFFRGKELRTKEPAQVPIDFSVEGKHWHQINFANHFAADFGQYHTDELGGMWSLLNLNKLYEAMFLK